MDYNNKTNEDLIKDIIALKNENDSLKEANNILLSNINIADKALYISEERFRHAFEFSAVGMCLVNTDGQFILVNNSFEKMLGYDKNEITKLTFNDITYPDDISIGSAILNRLLLNEIETAVLEKRYVHKNGDILLVSISTSLIFNNGNPSFFFSQVVDITNSRKIEEELRKSEENYKSLSRQFESILDQIPTMVYFKDKSNNFIRVNKLVAAYYGKNKSELEGINLSKLHSQEIAEKFYQDDLFVINGLNSKNDILDLFETPFGKRWIKTNKIPYVSDEGKVTGVIGIGTDITDVKDAEYEKLKIEDTLRTLSKAIEQSPVTTVVTDLKGNIEYVNPKFTETTLYTSDEAIGQNPRMLKSDTYDSSHYKQLWETILSGNNWRGEFYNRKKNGEFYWESAIISPVKDRYGAITHFLALKEDITELKKIQESAKENEERLNRAESIGKLGNWEYDLITNKIYWSKQVFVLFERDPSLEAPSIEEESEYYSEQFNNTLKEHANKVIETGVPVKDYEFEIKLASGTHKIFIGSMYPVKNLNKQVTKLFGTLQDITDRKQTDQIIKQKNKELTELNRTKDKFFSIIAHDLKAPFSVLLGICELIMKRIESYDKEKIETLVQTLNTTALNTFKLLENLLEWSQLQRGKIKPEFHQIDLMELINSLCLLFIEIAQNKDITFINNISSNIKVYCDFNMTNTVLRNLISNAIKFTSANGIVSVDMNDTGEYIEIQIKDSGVGISPENMPYLFSIEKDISTTGTKGEKGTGIGLLLSKEFVEKQGGKIWAESEPGYGSTFYFTLKKAV